MGQFTCSKYSDYDLLTWENDYDIRRIYLGPYADRPFQLRNEIVGIVSNPNCEYEANFVPLRTLAIYANSKDSYDPEKALEQAVEVTEYINFCLVQGLASLI